MVAVIRYGDGSGLGANDFCSPSICDVAIGDGCGCIRLLIITSAAVSTILMTAKYETIGMRIESETRIGRFRSDNVNA